ncbi:MAG: Hpt domain-containing protein [Lachnospiraceae bacterium]|nr:Hpt domain-containing protein [Lachnospiraceae bacterium]
MSRIDVDEALLRLGGNEQVFKMLLKKFLNNPYFSDLCNHMATGNLIEAEHSAHTIKGTAGNLGLTDLQEAATQLDDILRIQAEYQAAFTHFKNIYADTMTEVSNYIA